MYLKIYGQDFNIMSHVMSGKTEYIVKPRKYAYKKKSMFAFDEQMDDSETLKV